MSRAYCLTCNEPVHETPSGTCPLGHPVTTHDHGPEPWVGFAGDEDHEGHTTTGPAHVPMERLGADGRPAVPAGHASNGVNGSANGHGAALGGGHGHADPFPSAFGHRSSFATPDEPPMPPTERAPATGAAADDLAALLADALNGAADLTEQDEAAWTDGDHGGDGVHAPAEDGPGEAPQASWYDAPEGDWDDDLSSLAAELQLDANPRDDGPAAPPVAEVEEATFDTDNLDELLAELTGGLATEPDATPPPPPPPAGAEPTLAPPPVPAPDPADDAPAAWDDVASDPPAPEPVDLWAEPTPEPTDPTPVEPPVDLTNFTARGKRVGDAGPGRPRKSRGWKR